MSLDLDKPGWARVTLGSVAGASKEKVDPSDGSVGRFVAGEHMDSDDLRISRWGDPRDTELGPAFHRRFHPGQVLYGSRRTYLRKVAVTDFDGVCANTTFVIESKDANVLMQEFLPFVMSCEPFHSFAITESKGSVNPYVNWSDIERYEFDLPPLDEQRRIADLFWAIEHYRLALRNQAHELRQLRRVITRKRLTALPETRRLGDLATTRSGPSFSASDVNDSPVDGAIPVIGIPNTKPDGTVNLADIGWVTGLPDSVGRVDESSLILIRTNGNRKRIGNVYLPPAEAHGHAVSAFQFLMRVGDPSNREFLYWVLNGPEMQDRMSEGASGSVGLGNLAVRWLNEQHVPWSTNPNDRAALVEELGLLTSAIDSVDRESAALTRLRSCVRADVFGGN